MLALTVRYPLRVQETMPIKDTTVSFIKQPISFGAPEDAIRGETQERPQLTLEEELTEFLGRGTSKS